MLVHDGENSQRALTEAFWLREEVHTTKETRNLSDRENPGELIQTVHRNLERFMGQHPAYSKDGLQDWPSLFRFIYANRGIKMDEKVKKFLRMAILTQKVIGFRKAFAKKACK